MINAIKNKLSAKVFLITFVLLVLACSGTFLCVLKIMPSSYLDTLNRNAEAQSLELLDSIFFKVTIPKRTQNQTNFIPIQSIPKLT